MIEHLVLFKFKADAPPGQAERVAAALKVLKNKIPGIIHLTSGLNFSDRAKGYELGLVVRFLDRAALDHYAQHPEHVAVVEKLVKPHAADVLALDYEF